MPMSAPAPIAPTSSTRLWRTTRYAACCLAGALTLAGCGASNPSTGASTTGSGGSSAGTGAPRNGGATGGAGGFGAGRGGFGGGPSGLIAAVDGRTLQVQTRTQQTAVVYTSSTRITRLVTTTAAALRVGECVTALPARPAGATTGGPRPTTSPAPTAPPSGPVEAATVQLRPASGGSCGFDGRPGGGGGPGAGTARPTGTRTAGPTGGAAGRGGFGGGFGGAGFGAFGTIASVGQGSFTVTETVRSGAGASTTPRTVTVTDGQGTVFLLESPATASAIEVGECARASGRPDDTGKVTATALALSPATDGTCTGGFGAGRA